MASVIDNTPAACSWKVYAGDRNRQVFAFFATEGVPWDLTGNTIQAQARLEATDAVVAVEALCVITDPPAGIVEVSWDGEAIRTLLGGQPSWAGVWDMQIIEAGQTLPVTLLKGSFTAEMDVTKP